MIFLVRTKKPGGWLTKRRQAKNEDFKVLECKSLIINELPVTNLTCPRYPFSCSLNTKVYTTKCYNNIRICIVSGVPEIYIGYATNVMRVYCLHK